LFLLLVVVVVVVVVQVRLMVGAGQHHLIVTSPFCDGIRCFITSRKIV